MSVKEKSISTKYIRIYHALLFLIPSIYLAFVIYIRFLSQDFNFIAVITTSIYLIAAFYLFQKKWLPFLKAVKQISFTDEFLFIHDKYEDIQIPLERIRDVELKSLDGLYEFHLVDTLYFGQKVYCKTSMWYPINYKKVDQQLDKIRQLINKRKRSIYSGASLSLPSNFSY